ncbi:MAG: hypothetical protein ACRC9P_01445 [Bacteroides sp.]
MTQETQQGVEAPVSNSESLGVQGNAPVNTPQGFDPKAVAQELAGLLPKEEPKQEVKQEVQEEPQLTGVFNDTLPEELKGNVHLEGLFNIAKAQFPNLDLNRTLSRAWESGDPDLIDVNYLREVAGDEFGKYYGEYFSDLINSYTESRVQELDQWANSVFEKVGGKPKWERITSTFNTNASPTVVETVKEFLDSVDPRQRDVGVEMILNFVQPYGILAKQGAKAGELGGATPATATGSALSSKEYMAEVAKLSNSGRLTESGALEELRARRAAGVQAGLA